MSYFCTHSMLHTVLIALAVLVGLLQLTILAIIVYLGFKGVLNVYGGKRISFKQLNLYISNPDLANYKKLFVQMKWLLAFQLLAILCVIILSVFSWIQ